MRGRPRDFISGIASAGNRRRRVVGARKQCRILRTHVTRVGTALDACGWSCDMYAIVISPVLAKSNAVVRTMNWLIMVQQLEIVG